MTRIVPLNIRVTPGLDRRLRAAVERANIGRPKKYRVSIAQFVIDAVTAAVVQSEEVSRAVDLITAIPEAKGDE